MAHIYWSPAAKESYAAILKYLVDNFPVETALKTDDKVEQLLNLLEQNRHLCPPSSSFPELRRCVVTPYLSVVYRLNENDIELIVFVDNRTDQPF